MQQKRSKNRLRLVVAGWLLLAGCEPSIETELNEKIGGGPYFAASEDVPPVDSSGDSDTGAGAAFQPEPADNPTPDIKVGWLNLPTDAVSEDEPLLLSVESLSRKDLRIEITLEFAGLVDREASVSMGTRSLPADGRVTLSLLPGEFPLQTSSGACQLMARVVPLAADNDIAEGAIAVSPSLFYVFDASWTHVQVFGETVFLQDRGGVLSRLSAAEVSHPETAILGRVKTVDGQFEIVNALRTSTVGGVPMASMIVETRVEDVIEAVEEMEVSDAQ